SSLRSSLYRRTCDLRDLPSFPTRRSSDLDLAAGDLGVAPLARLPLDIVHDLLEYGHRDRPLLARLHQTGQDLLALEGLAAPVLLDRKSTRLNSSHVKISYAVFCLKKKTKK